MSLPYQNTSTGQNAIKQIQSILRSFGCDKFGTGEDFTTGDLYVQFERHGRQVILKANAKGYAVAWLKEHPWSHRMRRSRVQHEQEALRIAGVAVYSILRDWIKGQVTAIECGILSFEAAFLANVMLPSGRTIMQHVTENKLLLTGPSQAASTH